MRPVPASLRTASEWCWRSLVIIGAVVVVALALARLRIVVVPVVSALILATVLVPPARWLERRRWPSWLAAAAVFVGFLAVLAGAGLLVVPRVAAEFGALGSALSDAIRSVERWATGEPLELSAGEVDRYREQLVGAVRGSIGSGGLLAGAVAAGEVAAGVVLALMTTFFVVKDGASIQRSLLAIAPAEQRESLRTAARAAWSALGSYVRAAASLGAIEAAVIGTAVAVVGGELAVAVAVLTFLGGFVPIVGAVTAGVVAVLTTLATSGAGDAAIVGAVALAVQQLDNDLLAPVVYGRAIRLHPLVLVIGIAAGATVWGITGAFLVVPALAVCAAVVRAFRPSGSDSDEQRSDAAGS